MNFHTLTIIVFQLDLCCWIQQDKKSLTVLRELTTGDILSLTLIWIDSFFLSKCGNARSWIFLGVLKHVFLPFPVSTESHSRVLADGRRRLRRSAATFQLWWWWPRWIFYTEQTSTPLRQRSLQEALEFIWSRPRSRKTSMLTRWLIMI